MGGRPGGCSTRLTSESMGRVLSDRMKRPPRLMLVTWLDRNMSRVDQSTVISTWYRSSVRFSGQGGVESLMHRNGISLAGERRGHPARDGRIPPLPAPALPGDTAPGARPAARRAARHVVRADRP